MATQPNTHSRSSPSLSNHSANTTGTKRKRTATEVKHYAVQVGKHPGVYETWEECLRQIKGHKGAVFKSFNSRSEAQSFAEGRASSSHSASNPSTEQKYYAVQIGKIPGVYTEWSLALNQITGIKNAKHKKFNTRQEAEAYVSAGKKITGYSSSERKINASTPTLTPEEEARKQMIRNSAPGLQTSGRYSPRDKEGNGYEFGRGPLPFGAEDGFDPNIKLSSDGEIVAKTEDERLKTKLVPKEADPPGMLRIYTDGSSLRNGQAGARAGVGVFFGPADPKNVSEALKGSKQTNQRAELTAILRALDIAPLHRDVTIYTDSKYSIECVTNWYKSWLANGWVNSKGKPVENRDLVSDIRDKINERNDLHRKTFFTWIKGHANDAGNIAADRLAVEGATKGLRTVNGYDKVEKDEADEDGDDTMDDDEYEGEDEEVKQAFAAMAEASDERNGTSRAKS